MDLSQVREEYENRGLDEIDLAHDPISQFKIWYAEVESSGYWEPNAMVLATADLEGKPSARNVLLKDISTSGFVFFTNYISDKAMELDSNREATLVFSWTELRRQVIVKGRAERVSDGKSDEYWFTRPRGSQLGAWASEQSRIIPDRSYLEDAFVVQENRWNDSAIPRPQNWGGYLVCPEEVEFWQGRSNRLHDRLKYSRTSNGWKTKRLSP